ncbi:hypothetical protein [uncultured Alteromonas sp.]|jgi:hypothetical protein|uniref:hypothetical protein n=1 Tax=uncultured Alteromonas sp. TaxID=179113 RepID=UPI00258F0417|nr:hypothetical protein [uncultured Alteromonas sp.]
MLTKGAKVCHIGGLEHGVGEVIKTDEQQGSCTVIFNNASFTGVSCENFVLVSELSPKQKDNLNNMLSKQTPQYNKSKVNKNQSVKKMVNLVFIVFGGLSFLFLILIIHRLLTGADAPCHIQYERAWAACNDEYNGKCTYLGSNYKPSCRMNNDDFYRN